MHFDVLHYKNLFLFSQAKDRTQMTALHSAASNGSYEVCELLLQHGADIRCRDEEDMTPLHFASMEGHFGELIIKLRFYFTLSSAKNVDPQIDTKIIHCYHV